MNAKRKGLSEEAAREMISYTTATVLATSIHTTALIAGVAMSESLMERAIAAHVPRDRDPKGEFCAIVRGIMQDMLTTSEEWRRDEPPAG